MTETLRAVYAWTSVGIQQAKNAGLYHGHAACNLSSCLSNILCWLSEQVAEGFEYSGQTSHKCTSVVFSDAVMLVS